MQKLFGGLRGGLSLTVLRIGIILAASTGVIGASVTLLGVMALPQMMKQSYSKPIATGTIASAGTLGILIPPSIMLVIMADLLGKSVGNLFVAAVFPGFLLSGLYFIYIFTVSSLKPQIAPPLRADIGPKTTVAYILMVFRSFVPPVFLLICVLGSILGGIATPTEASAVGAFGATLLAFFNLVIFPAFSSKPENGQKRGRLRAKFKEFGGTLKDVTERSALTGGMLFGIFIGATGSVEMRNSMIVSSAFYFPISYWMLLEYGNHGIWAAVWIWLILRALTLLALYPRIRARAESAMAA